MRVHVKLAKSVTTVSGNFSEFTGTLDERTGIVWLDPVQGKGRRVDAQRYGGTRMGVKISEGSTVVELPEVAATEKAKTAAKGAPAA